MRITYRMMTSKYSSNLNGLSVQLDKLNTQVATGRKYSRSSEDVSSAVRGYQIRRNLAKIEGYQNNISHAQGFLTNSESALGQIEGSLSEAADKVLSGMNETKTADDRKIIATELREIQKQILETLNTSATGQFLFGGTADEKPFTTADPTDPNSPLLYRGQALSGVTSNVDDALYLDIGLGVKFEAGVVDSNSVFEYSMPGINFTGYGEKNLTSGETVSNNIYDLIGRIATEFEKTEADYSSKDADELYGLLKNSVQKTFQATTEVGARSNYLEFMTNRYETQELNLQQRQTEVEGIDAAYVYIQFQSQKVAYQAALQMGQSVVQQSVFDYMT